VGLLPEDIDYFAEVMREIPGFWLRLGGKPDFTGKDVLDLGCGHGSMCVDLALSGASRVVGVDTDEQRISFARAYTRLHWPELAPVLEFAAEDVRGYAGLPFDYAVSRATFEHVLDFSGVMCALAERLKPGGRLCAALGPLYYSPFGDHRRTESLIPWGHVLQPERLVLARLNRTRACKLSSIQDLGLNKLAPADYRAAFARSGLKTVYYRENLVMPSAGPARRVCGRLMSALRRVPALEKYFTVNIWCILEKPQELRLSAV